MTKRCLNCARTFTGQGWACPNCGFSPDLSGPVPVFAPELAESNDTYGADFFAHLAELERGHFWFEARNRLILDALRRWFPDTRSFLEIGCGTGFVLQGVRAAFPDARLAGSDLLVEGLRFAAGRVPSAELLQMDARAIPYHQAFDVIGAFDVIEHIVEDETALKQMAEAVKPGGGILISVPQHMALWSEIDDMSYHKRRYEKADLLAKVERAGLTVLATTSFVSLLLPVMRLQRALKGAGGAEVDLYAEFRLSRPVNTVLSAAMAAEFALYRAGVRFRWGGSRLVVARRPVGQP